MTIGWHFDNTYAKLPDTFKENIDPIPVKEPDLVILNKKLAKNLDLDFSKTNKKEISKRIISICNYLDLDKSFESFFLDVCWQTSKVYTLDYNYSVGNFNFLALHTFQEPKYLIINQK